MRTVGFTTLGCKTNQYESAALREAIARKGFRVGGTEEPADICIVNTCTVTGVTSYQSRQEIRRLLKANPSSVIVVTGCYAQVEPEAIAKIQGVDYVIGNGGKGSIARLIENFRKEDEPQVWVGDVHCLETVDDPEIETFSGRTRAFLKVQDGCDAYCTFCIIPFARGRSRSLAADKVLERVRRLARAGFREAVLTGIHLGAYGQDLPSQVNLAGLLRMIEDEGLPLRIRVSSVEPNEVDRELIGTVAESRSICHHFHLPLQSGDDWVLKRMGRKYTAAQYAETVQEIAATIPDACIGADVMVGFPGETEERFGNTWSLIDRLPLSYLHIFPYSRREGTAAAQFAGEVDPSVAKHRAQVLRELSSMKKAQFLRRFVGQRLEVLVEQARDKATSKLKGFAANYLPVIFEGDDSLVNQNVRVVASHVEGGRLIGEAC